MMFRFHYTTHALIALWDLSLTGLVPAFSASSVADQLASNNTGGPFPLERFFHDRYARLFASIANLGAVIVGKASGMLVVSCLQRFFLSFSWPLGSNFKSWFVPFGCSGSLNCDIRRVKGI